MRKIHGAYILNEKKVPFNIEIPSKWEELDRMQFARVIEVLSFSKADKFTISVSLLALLFDSKNWDVLRNQTDEHLTALIPCTNFLMEEKPPLQNFFPVLNIKKKKHLAPAADLSNLSFGEWCFVHQFYVYYCISQDKIWLDKIIAVLYRPRDKNQNPNSPKFSGDEREIFNENLIEKRTLSVAHIEAHIKLGVLAWFTVALNQLTEIRPHVFPKPAERENQDPEIPEAEPEPIDLSRTWLTIFRELLGPKWGTSDQLKNTNAMFVLDELEDRHIAYEEAKKAN